MLILNDFFTGFAKKDKIELITFLCNPERNWTLLAISSDPVILKRCQKVVVLKEGKVLEEANFKELKDRGVLKDLFDI